MIEIRSPLVFVLLVSVYLGQAQLSFVKKWDYRYGGDKNDAVYTLQKTADNGFVLSGFSNSGITGDKTQPNWDSALFYDDVWVVKLDSNGYKQWDKRFGGTDSEGSHALKQTIDNGYIIAAGTTSGISGDKSQARRGDIDYWVIKIDELGNKEWDKTLGGTNYDNTWAVEQTADGNYLVGGESSSGIGGDKTQPAWGGGYTDAWVVKLDGQGHKLWDRRFGGFSNDDMYTVLQMNDGRYLFAGSTSSDSTGDVTATGWAGQKDYWIVKADTNGNKIWDKRFGGYDQDILSTAIKAKDGGYLLGGRSFSTAGGNKTDSVPGYWIVKIDADGNKLWDKGYGCGQPGYEDYFSSLYQTGDGGFLLSGRSSSNIAGDKTENNLAFHQGWIVKIDSVGNKQWDKTIFTTKDNDGYVVQAADGCYVVAIVTASGIGGYKTQPNWDTSINAFSSDFWILKFCMEPFNALDDRLKTQDTRQLQVYPNPFTSNLQIALTAQHQTSATFTITNTIGQTLYHQTESNLATSYTKMLDLSYLPNGLYFVEVVVDGERVVRRIVKE